MSNIALLIQNPSALDRRFLTNAASLSFLCFLGMMVGAVLTMGPYIAFFYALISGAITGLAGMVLPDIYPRRAKAIDFMIYSGPSSLAGAALLAASAAWVL